MNSPNILITNYCDQECLYCFAKKLMADKSLPKEMSLADYKSVIRKIKRLGNNINTLKLFGGEPTLHTQFEEIIKYSFKYFPKIRIYTNGIFSERVNRLLENYMPKITFNFNVITPVIQSNSKLRKLFLKRILNFANLTEVSLSMTINPNLDLDKDSIINILSEDMIKKTRLIRIGASNPISGSKNLYKADQFQSMGLKACELIKKLNNINSKLIFYLDCGFTRCMFDKQEQLFLNKKNIIHAGWGCYYGNIDILTNMQTIPCYSLSEVYKLNSKYLSFKKIRNKFLIKEYIYGQKYIWNKCKHCVYYGFDKNKCNGPCIAFLMNSIHEKI